MNILIGFLYVVEVLVCLLLGFVVMLQKPKEGGLGGAFGGGALEASLGADAGNVLIKATAVLAAIFLLNTLVLAKFTSTRKSGSVVAGEVAAPVQQVPAPSAAPAPAPAPAEIPAEVPAEVPAAPAAEIPAEVPAAPAAEVPAAPAAPSAPAPEAK